jgi:diacylglycerol kinase (ATP)
MKILVIVNPMPKGGRALRLLPKIKQWLSQSTHHFSYVTCKNPSDMRAQMVAASNQGIEGFLLAGGDGTVHEALQAIGETALPFGLLPCGRGNDFARNIGLSSGLSFKSHFPSTLNSKTIDLPNVNGISFGSIACVGFDAAVNRLTRDQKGFFKGKVGYVVCVLKALNDFRPFEVEIKIDHDSWQGRVMMVAIANGPFYGGGMKIAPGALMDDGQLDVYVIEEVPRWELLRQFPKVYRGLHTSHPKVVVKSGQVIRITSDEDREIFADGEYVGNLPCIATVGRKKVSVLVPSLN